MSLLDINGMRVSARAIASSGRLVAKLLAALAAALLAKQSAVLDVPSGRGAMRDAWRDAEVRKARVAGSRLMPSRIQTRRFCPQRI